MLSTLAGLIYDTAVLITPPVVWRFVEAIFRMLGTAWTLVYNLPWRATFGLALEVMNMVLWIFWAVAWIATSVLQSLLQWPVIMGWEYISSGYTHLWKLVQTFVTVFTIAWGYITSTVSFLHQQGSYIIKGSKINYGPLFYHLWDTHAPLIAVLVVIATCLLIWHNQQNRSRREGSEEGRREIHQQRGSRLASRNNPDIDIDSITNGTNTASIIPPGASKQNNASQMSTDSDTELLRKMLCQANKKLSREQDKLLHVELLQKQLQEANKELSRGRDKFLCVELLQRQLQEANEELSQERDKFLCIVCQDLKWEVILKPCNHYCLCPNCSKTLKLCPICKCRIKKTEKVYLP